MLGVRIWTNRIGFCNYSEVLGSRAFNVSITYILEGSASYFMSHNEWVGDTF